MDRAGHRIPARNPQGSIHRNGPYYPDIGRSELANRDRGRRLQCSSPAFQQESSHGRDPLQLMRRRDSGNANDNSLAGARSVRIRKAPCGSSFATTFIPTEFSRTSCAAAGITASHFISAAKSRNGRRRILTQLWCSLHARDCKKYKKREGFKARWSSRNRTSSTSRFSPLRANGWAREMSPANSTRRN